MGAGGSVGGEGYIPTVEQKQDMVHRLQNQYAEHVATSASGNDIYKSLADTYAAGASAWMTPSATATMHLTTPNDAAAVENALQDFSQQPESGKTFRPLDGSFSGSLSPRSALSPVACKSGSGKLVNEIDDDFDHGNPMLRVKTNVDLLESLDQSTMESDNEVKLSTFMKTLNAEDADKNTRTSQFRKRRLTYSQRVYGANEAVEPDRRERTKRTSIYASTEIGVRQEKVPPFPDNYMGTFSCHGIEPGDNDEVYDKINQDRGCVVYPYNSSMTECLFIVLDGHGEQGDKVSEFVMRQVVISLEKHSHILMDPSVALVETFVKTNKALQATEINFMTSGCTCVAAYITGSMMYVANCGDSRAVMARGSKALDSLKAAELSRDHKPDDPLEFERITSMGGFVQPAPEPGLTARVYLDASHTMIGLAMARSIGDYAVKGVGVTAVPDVEIFDITAEDQFMILASDGVWEFIYSQEAVDIVAGVLREGGSVTDACQELIGQSAQKWVEEEGDYRDDITAIVIRFPLPHQSSLDFA